jgi:hypothetical protein
MEASKGVMRGQVESLMKLLEALDKAGIQLISDNATSSAGGRGVRLKNPLTANIISLPLTLICMT